MHIWKKNHIIKFNSQKMLVQNSLCSNWSERLRALLRRFTWTDYRERRTNASVLLKDEFFSKLKKVRRIGERLHIEPRKSFNNAVFFKWFGLSLPWFFYRLHSGNPERIFMILPHSFLFNWEALRWLPSAFFRILVLRARRTVGFIYYCRLIAVRFSVSLWISYVN